MPNKDHYYSPLRYPGGKRKIVPFFEAIFKEMDFCGNTYVEPFAGGAAVGLTLLQEEYVSKIVINDLDRSIFAFWYSVLNYNSELIEMIDRCLVNMDTWYLMKEIQSRKKDADLLELGFSTFFLNRTNKSGIIDGGVIGGKDQSGKWKIDARFNKKSLIQRIRMIGYFKSRIVIKNLDAKELISEYKNSSERTVFYFDPPYYVKGQELYLNFFSHDDHGSLAESIETLNESDIAWIVSYDNHRAIRDLYQNYQQAVYTLNYSAARPSVGKEVLVFSPKIRLNSSSNYSQYLRDFFPIQCIP